MVAYKIRGELLFLLPEKCIYWKQKEYLLVSDLHLGKVDHFRKHGIGLPSKASMNNYLRLENLILTFFPKKVIFLGDLFHSEMNSDWDLLAALIAKYPNISFELVKGNHDIIKEDKFEHLLHRVYPDSLIIGAFIFSHHPMAHASLYNICGHVHPAVKLYGTGRQTLSLPCFAFSTVTGILPSFGTFTGKHHIKPDSFEEVFIIADNQVVRIKQ